MIGRDVRLILILAHAHGIPIPPELVPVGDLPAYIDIFSVVFLPGLMSRAALQPFY
ncbi:MAG TPA: hypothetical protein VHJ00_07820 [Bradyrhizobium sp.]|nr:hypothetical protein [Bradyrhizobium sp.]